MRPTPSEFAKLLDSASFQSRSIFVFTTQDLANKFKDFVETYYPNDGIQIHVQKPCLVYNIHPRIMERCRAPPPKPCEFISTEKDIQLIMSQANVSYEKAAKALLDNADVVNAIIDLTT